MTKRRLVWNLLSILCVAALLVSGAWVKGADAARLTHHELTLKDEKGKPLGQAQCAIRDKEGNYLAYVISSVDGLIVAMAHPGATLRCISKELTVHEGEVKAGRKDIITKKLPLSSCYACNSFQGLSGPPGAQAGMCCESPGNYEHCEMKWGQCSPK